MADPILEKLMAGIVELKIRFEKVDEDGLFHLVSENGINFKISLDNARHEFEQDGTFDRLESMLASMKDSVADFSPKREWADIKNSVFWQFCPADQESGGFISRPMSDDFQQYFILDPAEGYITWIGDHHLEQWGISEPEFFEAVEKNMETELAAAKIEFQEMPDSARLCFFNCEKTWLKAAFLFCKKFKDKIEPLAGWPVYAVLPNRDYCLFFSEKDLEFFAEKIGEVVCEEFSGQGYQITTELIEFSDDGWAVVGRYDVQKWLEG